MAVKILAFDLGKSTGVAFAEGSNKPEFSTFKLGTGKTTHPALCAAAMRMTNKLIKRYEPDIIAFEAPYLDRRKPRAAALLYSLRGAVMGTAKINGIHPQEFTVNECRSFFINTVSLGRAEAKATVMQMCKTLGWDPKNNDESDAGAVLEKARSVEKVSTLMPKGGLF